MLLCTARLAPLAIAAVPVEQTFDAPASVDQDDMCLWVHPADPASSTLIASDKASGDVYVYDLAGTPLQTVPAVMPGNIDVRYGVELDGECVDLVAFNERDEQRIRVYQVNPVTRQLTRLDDGAIVTGPNYGFALERRADGSLFGYTGPQGASATVRQYLLHDNGAGAITGTPTAWQSQQGTVEGMVADDEAGTVYLAEEQVGIWRLSTSDASDKVLVAQVGDASGLAAEVEGLALYRSAGSTGLLIASSQGAGKFTVLQREPPHTPVGEFTVEGVGLTDGIEVLNIPLGDPFEQGIFAFHNGLACCPVQAAAWADVASELGVAIDTESWQPRRGCGAVLTVGLDSLSWTPWAPAQSYDVVRGDLSILHGTAGDFTQATTECLADDRVPTSLAYDAEPLAGHGEWYLVRGVAAFGPLSYDSFGPAQDGSRDAEIAAAVLACR